MVFDSGSQLTLLLKSRRETLVLFSYKRTDWDLATRLDHCEQALAAAQLHLDLATHKKCPGDIVIPPLDTLANGSAFDCEEIAAEAAALDDHRAIDRCIAIASRIEKLSWTFFFIDRADYDERSVVHYIALWLSHIGKVPVPAYKQSHPGYTALDSDAQLPCLGLTRAAGRACSCLLFDRARSISLQALRCHWIITLDGVTKVDRFYGRGSPLADEAHVAAHMLCAFVDGLLQAPITMGRDRAMEAARRVATVLVGPIVCFGVARPKSNMDGVLRAVEASYRAVCGAAATLKGRHIHDAAVYLTGALVAGIEALNTRSSTSSFYRSIAYESMVAYHGVFALLASATDSTTLDALVQGLDVKDYPEMRPPLPRGDIHHMADAHSGSGTSLPPVGRHADAACGADILLSLWTHEPDIYIDILSHLDPWDVGSLALASRAHYAYVAASVRLNDAQQGRRLHPHLLLSAGRPMSCLDGRIESLPERITPPPIDSDSLPDLAMVFFLCRTMPTVQGNLPYDRSSVPAAAARACLLGCGDALNRCVRSISYREPMQKPHTAWSYKCVAGVAEKRKHLARQLGRAAGQHGSATLVRIAWHQSVLHGLTTDENGDDDLDAKRVFLDAKLLSNVVGGVLEGLGSRDARRRDLCARGLSAITAVLCDTLLSAVASRSALGHVSDDMMVRMRDACEVGALNLLAPGKALPAAAARIALAAALARAACTNDGAH